MGLGHVGQVGQGSNAMTRPQQLAEQHTLANREAAELILRDIERYGGPGSGLVLWAKAVLERGEQERSALGFMCVA